MKPLILVLACIGLSACGPQEPDWTNAPLTHRCTPDQAKQVDYETSTCVKTGTWSGYSGTYCFASAIIRNCPSITTGSKQPTAAKESGR